MQKMPGIYYPGGTRAFDEILINNLDLQFVNITIDYTAQYKVIPAFTLYGRQTVAPYKYAPFMTLMQGAFTNTINATFTTTNTGWSSQLTVTTDGFWMWDATLLGLIGTGTTKAVPGTIMTLDINSAGVLTFTGQVFGNTPVDADDYLVLGDGTELSKDVVIVAEEIDFTALYTLGKDYVINALYAGTVNPNKVNGYAFLTPGDVQRLQFLVP